MADEDSSNFRSLESTNAPATYTMRFGDGVGFAEFEPSLWRLTVHHALGVSRQVSMGYAEVLLLSYFVQHPGEMITRQQLLDHAWGDRVVSQGSLNQAISNLRGLLGDDQRREIIITVPRRGYQFNSDALVEWQEWLQRRQEIAPPPALDPSPIPQASTIAAPQKIVQWQIPALLCAAIGMSLTLIIGIFAHYYYAIFPPYASEQVTMGALHLTILAKDQDAVDATRSSLMPILQRLEASGEGRVLINRNNTLVEFHCFPSQGAAHTLLAQIENLQLIQDSHLQECLK